MPRPRPPFLQKQTSRHGRVVWYVRRGSGPRIRINGAYGSTEFLTEYHAAVASLAIAAPKGNIGAGSLEWLIRRYRESSTWESLAHPSGAGPLYRGFPDRRSRVHCRRAWLTDGEGVVRQLVSRDLQSREGSGVRPWPSQGRRDQSGREQRDEDGA
jgi:hypothetical protein